MHSLLINLLLLTQVDPGSAEEDTVTTTIPIIWFILPVFVGILIYSVCVTAAWPYARPIFPIWLLILSILIPPLFPFLLFYILISIFLLTPNQYDERQVQVVVLERERDASSSSRGGRISKRDSSRR
jgi:hypothetical protein